MKLKRIGKKLYLFLIIVTLWCSTYGQNPFSNDLNDYVFDFNSLYQNNEEFYKEENEIETTLGKLYSFKQSDLTQKENLIAALEILETLRIRSAKMSIYGMLNRNINDVPETRDMLSLGRKMQSKVESEVAFIEEEIRNISKDKWQQWIRENKEIDKFKRRINKILWKAPHTLPANEQRIIEQVNDWTKVPYTLYWDLLNGDIGYPSLVLENNETITLNNDTFNEFRRHQDSSLRAQVIDSYFKFLSSRQRTFGSLLTERIKADRSIAKLRNFENGIDALWYLLDGMPPKSYQAMIDVVNQNHQATERYISLKMRLLDKDTFDYYDFYTPLSQLDKKIEVSQALKIAVEASKPLGVFYQKALQEKLNAKLIHMAPTDNKRSSYGIFPAVGSAHSYAVMNFNGDLESSNALMGAATLMMAFEGVPLENRPDSGDDPGIYANSIIYLGNFLHTDYLLSLSKSKAEKIALLSNTLERIWGLFHRYVLVTHWELEIENLIARNTVPSGEKLSQMYYDLLLKYYKNIKIPEAASAEWMTFRVPFYSYEHQFWPAAMAGACAVYNKLIEGDEKALQIVNVLGRGDLDMTYPLFLQVGIDMSNQNTYQEVFKTMNQLMEKLEFEMNTND